MKTPYDPKFLIELQKLGATFTSIKNNQHYEIVVPDGPTIVYMLKIKNFQIHAIVEFDGVVFDDYPIAEYDEHSVPNFFAIIADIALNQKHKKMQNVKDKAIEFFGKL